MNAWGNSWGSPSAWAASWGSAQPDVATVDGSGIHRRRVRLARRRDLDRLPEDLRREQLEEERYLAELEKNAPQSPATARRGKTGDEAEDQAPEKTTAVVPVLADAAALAASAQAVISRARASSAEVLAKVKAEDRRRDALLLLMLD